MTDGATLSAELIRTTDPRIGAAGSNESNRYSLWWVSTCRRSPWVEGTHDLMSPKADWKVATQ